jgi:hypothetical protein
MGIENKLLVLTSHEINVWNCDIPIYRELYESHYVT